MGNTSININFPMYMYPPPPHSMQGVPYGMPPSRYQMPPSMHYPGYPHYPYVNEQERGKPGER